MSTVNPFPQTLADVVTIAMRRHQVQSGRALAQVSERLGIAVNYTVLNQLHAGTYRRKMTPQIRHNLAELSGIRQPVIDRLAGAPMTSPFALPADQAATLNGEQREAVLAVVRAFANANAREVEQDEVESEAAYEPDYPMDADVDDDKRGDPT